MKEVITKTLQLVVKNHKDVIESKVLYCPMLKNHPKNLGFYQFCY